MNDLLERQFTFAVNVSNLIKYIFENGYQCTIGEVYRPPETAKIFAKEGRGITKSLHCDRLAIDINLFTSLNEYLKNTRDYAQFGKYWEALHPDNKWGGTFSDGNHFQMDLK